MFLSRQYLYNDLDVDYLSRSGKTELKKGKKKKNGKTELKKERKKKKHRRSELKAALRK